MIAWFAALPLWLLNHPWLTAAWIVGWMCFAVLALLLNRKDRQVREILRRRR